MAISGISAASFHAAASTPSSPSTAHKHGGRHTNSLTDINSTGSSMASAPSTTGKIGSKINITA